MSAIKWQAPKILFVITSTTVGGAEKALHQIVTGLDPKRFSASVVSVKPLGEYGRALDASGYPVRSLDQGRVPSPAAVFDLARLIKKERPDLVHALMFSAIELTRVALKLSGLRVPLVTSPHINYRSRSALTLVLDRVLKNADALTIAECETTRRYLLEHLGYESRKVIAVHNGVELGSNGNSHSARSRIRQGAQVADRELFIGAMGRLDRQKNHALLIEALARLKGRFPFKAAILGEGPLRADLERLIAERGLEGTVSLPGESRDVQGWLSAFDLFVQPSLWEGFPYSILEAMARGLPVIASRVDGVVEMIENGKNGILVPPGQPETLVRAISSIAQDAGPRRRLGEAARKTIEKNFGVEQMVSKYAAAYEAVLENGKKKERERNRKIGTETGKS